MSIFKKKPQSAPKAAMQQFHPNRLQVIQQQVYDKMVQLGELEYNQRAYNERAEKCKAEIDTLVSEAEAIQAANRATQAAEVEKAKRAAEAIKAKSPTSGDDAGVTTPTKPDVKCEAV